MAGLLDLFTGDNADAMIAVGGGLLSRNPAAGFARAQNLLAEAPYRRLQMEQQRMQMEQAQMQMEQARQAQAKERGLLEMQAQFMQPGQQAQGGTADVNAALPPDMRIGAQAPIPGRAPQFDVSGYTAAAVQKGLMSPIDAYKLQSSMKPASAINKLDVKDFTTASVAKFQQTGNYADLERMDKLHFADTGGGIAGLNQFTGKPVNTVSKTGNPFNDLILSDGQGGMRPNSPLIGAKSSIARAGASNVSVNTGQKGLDNELSIHSKWRAEPIYKAHQEVQSAHSQITAALKQASPAGDLAGATKLMKILDPGSVVRESELGMAMAASGALDRLQHYASNVMNGTKLTPTQRADFQRLADSLYTESGNQFNAKRKEYAGFANEYGLNADRITGPAVTSPKLPPPAANVAAPRGGAGVRFLGFE